MTVVLGRERLDPEVFELPVEKMRDGYYTDAYFNHSRSALLAAGLHPRVLMQVFQKNRALLGGMDEAVAILKLCSHGWDNLVVRALHDGDWIEPWETILTIGTRGPGTTVRTTTMDQGTTAPRDRIHPPRTGSEPGVPSGFSRARDVHPPAFGR